MTDAKGAVVLLVSFKVRCCQQVVVAGGAISLPTGKDGCGFVSQSGQISNLSVWCGCYITKQQRNVHKLFISGSKFGPN